MNNEYLERYSTVIHVHLIKGFFLMKLNETLKYHIYKFAKAFENIIYVGSVIHVA